MLGLCLFTLVGLFQVVSAARCRPSAHRGERCGGIIVIIVLCVIAGISLTLVCCRMLLRFLRRRRELARNSDDIEATKQLASEGTKEKSQTGGSSSEGGRGSSTDDREFGVIEPGGDGDPATIIHLSLRGTITFVPTSPEFRTVVGKLPDVPMLSSEEMSTTENYSTYVERRHSRPISRIIASVEISEIMVVKIPAAEELAPLTEGAPTPIEEVPADEDLTPLTERAPTPIEKDGPIEFICEEASVLTAKEEPSVLAESPVYYYEASSDSEVRVSIYEADERSESPPLPPLPATPVLTTQADFQENIDIYVKHTGLQKFFPSSDSFTAAVAQKAAALRNDPTTDLGTPSNIPRLTRLSLYHLVIYCDDSGSMCGSPFAIQRELISRIARVATKIVPEDYGLDLYFINRGSFHNRTAQEVDVALRSIDPSGGTPIGTNLHRRILKPLVYDVLSDPGRILRRPLLVCAITDGCPTGEYEGAFKSAIVECRETIRRAGYPSTAVRFSVSQIGSDSDATRFLDGLAGDVDIQDVVRCTTDRLDEKYRELRQNERELETWLLQVLTNPIMENGRF